MKEFLRALFLSFVSLTSAHAAEQTDLIRIAQGGAYPHGTNIPCNGSYFWHNPAVLYWANFRPEPIRVYAIHAGMFQDFQVTVSDFFAEVRRGSTNLPVAPYFHWDHYQQPTAPVIMTKTFTPNYLEVAPGDGLMIVFGCNPIRQTGAGGTALVVDIEVNAR